MFIVFEGGEGAGKSTQAKILSQYLTDQGKKVLLTREPGGTENAEKIRKLLVSKTKDPWLKESEVFLFLAARLEHYYKTIKPHLEKGYIVICDRFILSTLAYQGYGYNLSIDWLKKLHADILPQNIPDLTFILSIPPKKGLSRVTEVQKFEMLDLPFHEKLFYGYHELAKQFPNCHVIDVSDKNIKTVHAQIVKTLTAHMKSQKISENIL